MKIVSFFNVKGGVGKTSFAFSIAKDLGLYLQSNDASIIESIYPKMSKISEKPQLIDNCVFDFGGFVSHGILEIAKKSDFSWLFFEVVIVLINFATCNQVSICNIQHEESSFSTRGILRPDG